jgi:hypothetical protein
MSEANEQSSDEESKDGTEMRAVPVEFFVPEDLDIKYADNFNVFFSDYDFTLTFLQTQAPLIFRDEEWETTGSVKAKGISRVVVPPHLIPRIVNVLSENWKRFMEIRQRQLQEKQHVNTTADAEAGNQPAEGGQS